VAAVGRLAADKLTGPIAGGVVAAAAGTAEQGQQGGAALDAA